MGNLSRFKNEFSSDVDYKIINVDSAQYGALANQGSLTMIGLSDSMQLKWKLERQSDNSYIIKSSYNNCVLQTVYNKSWTVSIGQHNGSDSQRFYINKVNDMNTGCYYEIKSKQSKLLLTCYLTTRNQTVETGIFFKSYNTYTIKTYFLKLDKALNTVTQKWIISS